MHLCYYFFGARPLGGLPPIVELESATRAFSSAALPPLGARTKLPVLAHTMFKKMGPCMPSFNVVTRHLRFAGALKQLGNPTQAYPDAT